MNYFDSRFARGVPTACVSGWRAGVDKTPRAGFCSGVEKCLKMAQNPTRQVHALLGVSESSDNLAAWLHIPEHGRRTSKEQEMT